MTYGMPAAFSAVSADLYSSRSASGTQKSPCVTERSSSRESDPCLRASASVRLTSPIDSSHCAGRARGALHVPWRTPCPGAQMQERRTERGLLPAFRVHLATVELASCIGSTTASTCVVHRLV